MKNIKNIFKNKTWTSKAIFIVVGLAVIVGAFSLLGKSPAVVETAEVEKGRLTVTVNEDGRTKVKDRYIISAPLTGNLARITINAGDAVDAKTILAKLLPLPSPLLDSRSYSEAKSRQESAEAALKQAEATFSRSTLALNLSSDEQENNQELFRKGAISKQTLEQSELEYSTRKEEKESANFGVKVATHEVALARVAIERLDSTTENSDQVVIYSPIDGIVLDIMRENEGVATAGTPLIEVGNPSSLEVVVAILTADAVSIEEGSKVKFTRWGGAEELEGHVRRIEPKAFTRVSSLGVEEQRVNVILDLDTPSEVWSDLGDGFRVEASIIVWDGTDILKAPVSALFKQNDKWSVFVVENGKASLREVTIGQRNDFESQIIAGVNEGEIIILHPGERISEGTSVTE